jgi:hypothetical protein
MLIDSTFSCVLLIIVVFLSVYAGWVLRGSFGTPDYLTGYRDGYRAVIREINKMAENPESIISKDGH